MIKYKQLPAQSFQSSQVKYDMKCLGISLFFGGEVFHSSLFAFFIPLGGISFLAICFFHSLGGHFISCPLHFSFPWRIFHSFPFAFFIPLRDISFLPLRIFHSLGGYFIPCLHFFHSSQADFRLMPLQSSDRHNLIIDNII
jgi:hypothetical protein